MYLAGVSSAQIQHMKEEAELTGQTELLLTQVILHQASNWLQEIQHLGTKERERYSLTDDSQGNLWISSSL